jgi:hypothetical protein
MSNGGKYNTSVHEDDFRLIWTARDGMGRDGMAVVWSIHVPDGHPRWTILGSCRRLAHACSRSTEVPAGPLQVVSGSCRRVPGGKNSSAKSSN